MTRALVQQTDETTELFIARLRIVELEEMLQLERSLRLTERVRAEALPETVHRRVEQMLVSNIRKLRNKLNNAKCLLIFAWVVAAVEGILLYVR